MNRKMPPKRGRGRGRGIPPSRQENNAPPGQQRPPRDLASSQIPNFCISPSEEVTRDEPTPSGAVPKQKTLTVHPEELGIELKQESLVKSVLPARPGFGSLGRRIKLISNCFPISIPDGYVYHYDVEIIKKEINSEPAATPENKNVKKYRSLHTKIKRRVISQMQETNNTFRELYAAYDGNKNLYTRKKLKGVSKDNPLRCEVVLPCENTGNSSDSSNLRQDSFEVEIKPVVKKETNSCGISLDTIHSFYEKTIASVPEEAIMAVETILRHGPCLKFTPIGRSFYFPPDTNDRHPLGEGLEVWFGYHQSIRLGQKSPLVNIDISATAFLKEGPVLNYIADLMGSTVQYLKKKPNIPHEEIDRINRKLKGKEIVLTHLPYRKTHWNFKLDTRNANNIRFRVTENGNEEEKTIAEYFSDRYNTNLEFPNLPCLVVTVGKDDMKHDIHYPIEVCHFTPGQHSRAKLTDKQKNAMIKFTSVAPEKRFREIEKIVLRKADFNQDRCLHEFGLKVSPDPLSLGGRVLDSPSLIYKDGDESDKKIRSKDGSWNLRFTQLREGADINRQWVLLSFAKIPDDDDLNEFCKTFRKVGIDMGIEIERPIYIQSFIDINCDMEKLLEVAKRRANLAVVVLPILGESEIYSKIKKASETVIGMTTQCIREENFRKVINDRPNISRQITSNIWLKVNAKMGGENSILMPGETPIILRKNVIIIGADVNHPAPYQVRGNQGRKPSLAACVGNVDENFVKYAASITPQFHEDGKKKAGEIIQNLQDMTVKLLKTYRKKTGKKPENIIFYRDGVSEGQFDDVRKQEIASIRKACRSLDANYKPGLTFIVVLKRHHVRFMPKDRRDAAGNAGNIPPGTVVDTDVTHPVNFDFFLCSHFGLKGTSRPTHYVVLEDENHFTADDLQKLTYQLCYMSVRCTRSISIPAPVAYADRAAYRARKHLEAGSDSEDDSDSDDDSTSELALLEAAMEAIEVVDDIKSSMYFV